MKIQRKRSDKSMSSRYTVDRIEELDFGCEGRPEGLRDAVKVVLKDVQGEEICVQASDSWLYANGVDTGSEVSLDSSGKIQTIK